MRNLFILSASVFLFQKTLHKKGKISMKNVAKWTGAAAILGGVLVLTGCQSSKVMDNRPYVPAASGDEVPAAMAPETTAASEVKDLPIAPAPAEKAPAAVADYPQFDSAAIEPVAPVKKNVAKGGIYVVQYGRRDGRQCRKPYHPSAQNRW